jgi:hypothetical protein
MKFWEKKNEIIKRCWAVNNAVEIARGEFRNVPDKETKRLLKDWYQFFYDMHSEWDLELAEAEETFTEKKIKADKGNDKAMEDGQAEADKLKIYGR